MEKLKLWWSQRTKSQKIWISVVGIIFLLGIANGGGKTTAECKDEQKAYQFGTDMAVMSSLSSSNLSLRKAIELTQESIGVETYSADDPWVKRGYEDEKAGIDSPYK